MARAYAGHSGKNDAGTTSAYVRADLSEVAGALAALTGEPHPLSGPSIHQGPDSGLVHDLSGDDHRVLGRAGADGVSTPDKYPSSLGCSTGCGGTHRRVGSTDRAPSRIGGRTIVACCWMYLGWDPIRHHDRCPMR